MDSEVNPDTGMLTLACLAFEVKLVASPESLAVLASTVADECADICDGFRLSNAAGWVPTKNAAAVAHELGAEIRAIFHCDGPRGAIVPSGAEAREFMKEVAAQCAALCSGAAPIGDADHVPEHHASAVGDALAALILERFNCRHGIYFDTKASDWLSRTGALMVVRDPRLALDDTESLTPVRWVRLFAARIRELDPRMTSADSNGLARQYFVNGRYLGIEPGRVATEWSATYGSKR